MTAAAKHRTHVDSRWPVEPQSAATPLPEVPTPGSPKNAITARSREATMATCPHCHTTWTGQRPCHCSAERSVAVPLTVWDGDTSLLADRNIQLDQCSPDTGGVTVQALADLVSAQTGPVEVSSLPMPPGSVRRSVLDSGQWTQVLWSVVGPVTVDVVNVLLGRHTPVDHPVLIGLDVAPRPDLPSKQDIPVRRRVPTRLVRRDLLPRSKRANSASTVADQPAGVAAASLSVSDDSSATVNADDLRHGTSLLVTALCHRTFSGIELFDRHRDHHGEHGRCLDPTTLRNVELRDGMWRRPEMTPDARAAFAAKKASQ